MNKKSSTSIISILPLSLILEVPGWTILVYMMTRTEPTLGNRWLFYLLVVAAVTGTVLPVVALINQIFGFKGPLTFDTVVRESMMVGVYAAALLWLNKGQFLSLGLGLVLALGMTTAEFLIRVRARSKWRPGENRTQ